jgi:alpha-tubulin suppressor-like RCC1 family protein
MRKRLGKKRKGKAMTGVEQGVFYRSLPLLFFILFISNLNTTTHHHTSSSGSMSRIFVTGNWSFGQLGLAYNESHAHDDRVMEPVELTAEPHATALHHTIRIAAGARHVIALTCMCERESVCVYESQSNC